MLIDMLIVLATVIVMEFVAWVSHKYVMHGIGWGWHASHHSPRNATGAASGVNRDPLDDDAPQALHASGAPAAGHHGWFEKNDLFAVVFAGFAIWLIWIGTRGVWPLQWIGAGMTAYGALYFVAHDGLVHGRWPLKVVPRSGYLKRLYQAHRLHHAVAGKDDCVSFAFLWAPSPQRLKQELAAIRARKTG
ncbi:MAG: beta-carotene hydroxylase [Rhizobacter sp.]|nr:beta-carotene hydroxylase [Rhizobacter sp.]